MSDLEENGHAALASVQTAWNAAAQPWNPRSLSAIYTDDALLFGGRPQHSVGADAIHDYFAAYDGIIISASLELRDQSLIQIGPQCFVAQGYGEFSFVLVAERVTKSLLRTTLTIVRQNHWRLCQHHFSPLPASPPLGAC
jgi:hypothetical protein